MTPYLDILIKDALEEVFPDELSQVHWYSKHFHQQCRLNVLKMFPCAQQCMLLGAGVELHHMSRHVTRIRRYDREICSLRKTWPTLDTPFQIFSGLTEKGFNRSAEGKLCPQSSEDLLQGSSSDWCLCAP